MHAEADIEQAAIHGVSVETIKALRLERLVENEHWLKLSSGAIAYTDDGEQAVALLLATPTPPENDGQKKEGGAKSPRTPRKQLPTQSRHRKRLFRC